MLVNFLYNFINHLYFYPFYRKLTEDFDGAVRRLNEYETEI
jgi:hypothetical protein